MGKVMLELEASTYNELLSHLLPTGADFERAAFVFASASATGDDVLFREVEWLLVNQDGLSASSDVYLELSDETRAFIIKRAHDLGASLVEFHSHLGAWPAAFSSSDRMGFQEFVPHVWWRLKGKPYLAIVVAASGFDGLAWITNPNTPAALDGLVIGKRCLRPTGLSFKNWDKHERKPI